MASNRNFLIAAIIFVSLLAWLANAQLSPNFYARTCPNIQGIVHNAMMQAVGRESRMGASILRMFFYDCFVNVCNQNSLLSFLAAGSSNNIMIYLGFLMQGCDASVLLDDTATFTGEKTAQPNQNSLRGFEVIDAIKSRVKAACNATVTCVDILALAARDGVILVSVSDIMIVTYFCSNSLFRA